MAGIRDTYIFIYEQCPNESLLDAAALCIVVHVHMYVWGGYY